MTDPSIYKILTPDQWAALRDKGETAGSPLDIADGYVHFSTRDQLQGTLDIHYTAAGELVLAEVALSEFLQEAVRWEPARDGSLFPHLYAALPFAAVTRHWPLHPDPQGRYALPDLT